MQVPFYSTPANRFASNAFAIGLTRNRAFCVQYGVWNCGNGIIFPCDACAFIIIDRICPIRDAYCVCKYWTLSTFICQTLFIIIILSLQLVCSSHWCRAAKVDVVCRCSPIISRKLAFHIAFAHMVNTSAQHIGPIGSIHLFIMYSPYHHRVNSKN